MSDNIAEMLRCPVCREPQLNRDLLKAHLIQKHGRTVEQAEKAARPLGALDDMFNAFHEAREAVE